MIVLSVWLQASDHRNVANHGSICNFVPSALRGPRNGWVTRGSCPPRAALRAQGVPGKGVISAVSMPEGHQEPVRTRVREAGEGKEAAAGGQGRGWEPWAGAVWWNEEGERTESEGHEEVMVQGLVAPVTCSQSPCLHPEASPFPSSRDPTLASPSALQSPP